MAVMQRRRDGALSGFQGFVASLPFEEGTFDAVTVAFGVRNFENLSKGLAEISRVLKANGQVCILEFSMPEKFPVKQLYRFYFKRVMPKIGKWLSKDDGAYSYLPTSVEKFPKPAVFGDMLTSFGLKTQHIKRLSLGIATLYVAIKE